jgi:hypothetical protein
MAWLVLFLTENQRAKQEFSLLVRGILETFNSGIMSHIVNKQLCNARLLKRREIKPPTGKRVLGNITHKLNASPTDKNMKKKLPYFWLYSTLVS